MPECSNCGLEDTSINIYGTICKHCKCYIPANEKPQFLQENELKHKLLQEKCRSLFRKKFLEAQQNGNRQQ